ncbi:MAG TPA: DUF3857 and transglutaminase domain-containing protein [Pyrinomonadaceae bacterium]|nr:DUF3857 and transglutaminase domain-containing protein [Pyrinomonadaceae bacterium]
MLSEVRLIFLIGCVIVLGGFAFASDEPRAWRPVTPAELQMKAPLVEPDADAEAIFWETWLDDKKLNSIYYEHYVRVKIFTARGQEKFSKFDIPFTKGKKIEDIAARVIKPDGSILTLDPKDIFEREVVKAGKIKVMAKSFAIPGIEPGVIVEYRYKETYKDAWGNGIRLIFQKDIPMQKIVFHVRPQKGYTLVPTFYNMTATSFAEDPSDKGFLMASMSNVPAYKVEPQMPPEDEVRRWAFLNYYASDPGIWRRVNQKYAPWLNIYAKPTDLIRKKAAELTAGATTDDEKLRRIYDYIQKQIKNVDFDLTLTDEQREKLDHDHAEDTIKLGMGNSVYVELLFASLAKASGYEVNLVFSGDRSDNFFSPEKYPFAAFIHLACVAVKVQDEWKYFNASVPYVPYGYLTWNEEGVTAMLIGEEGFMWRNVPITDQDKSPAKRTADLTLSDDGTLEGTLKFEYWGQQAISRRRDNYNASEAKRRDNAEQQIKGQMSTSEVSNVTIENMSDTSKPLTYSMKVKIPNYAQRTGQRLFLQPGFFEYGVKPMFSASTREHGIYFAYPWSEHDSVDIHLPKGYELDSPDLPQPISDPKKIGSLKVLMNYDKAAGVLRYRRDFHFGGGGTVLFPTAAYPALKGMFDAFNKADSHIITLKRITPSE